MTRSITTLFAIIAVVATAVGGGMAIYSAHRRSVAQFEQAERYEEIQKAAQKAQQQAFKKLDDKMAELQKSLETGKTTASKPSTAPATMPGVD